MSLGDRLPDESTILRFRHLLEKHQLADQILATVNDLLQRRGLMVKAGTVVDGTLIEAPSSTKHRTSERDPEMHQTKKGNQWHFGMEAHIGVDADSGMVYTVRGTAANVNDVVAGNSLLPGQETVVFADRGLAKNTAQLNALFALCNRWMARRKLLALDGVVRPNTVIGV